MTASGDWRPSASQRALRRRAEILASVRSFFAERNVLEVETPALAAYTVTDPHLHSFRVRGTHGHAGYLQTSPEYAMKRLLAAGSGPIYQICRAYRDQERGHRHAREFTLLEWYRPGWSHLELMEEVTELVATVLRLSKPFDRVTYGRLFSSHLGVDPHRASDADLRRLSPEAPSDADRDALLALLLTHRIEPSFEPGVPLFVVDYPASQAALARLAASRGGRVVAERFELYVGPVEIANGFHELTDPDEQLRRFEADRAAREAAGLPVPKVDDRLLAALAHGLPDCAGVALGLDRLVLLALGGKSIDQVMAFTPENA